QPASPGEAGRERISSGSAGLDDILGGGFDADRVYLIEGRPGTGKATLALQFLLEGVRNGERCLYVTLSESERELRAVVARHGWGRLEGIEIFELVPPAASLDPGRTTDHAGRSTPLFGPGDYDGADAARRVPPGSAADRRADRLRHPPARPRSRYP